MKKIVSAQNQNVKRWHGLKRKHGRQAQRAYLLENWHLVAAALADHYPLREILMTPREYARHQDHLGPSNVILISSRVAERLSSTVHPEGTVAIADLPERRRLLPSDVKRGAWLFLDRVQDPGNIGTMVRTADAAGFTGVVFGSGSANLFNPKVVRAMQGSQFHLKLTSGSLTNWITSFRHNHLPVYGTALNPDVVDYRQVQPANDLGLIMGNEGHGMQSRLLALTSQNLYIPIEGQAESLNVAVAAGILMFSLKK